MKKLSVPLNHLTAEDLFVICVNGYKTKTKREHLMQARTCVAADALSYAELVPTRPYTASDLPRGVTDREMILVYEKQLAASKCDGRAYYDAIRNHALTCAYCGVGHNSTLDHYLPKSVYPTLVVAPVNLLPCCMECNHIKRDAEAAAPAEAPIHSYLEEIPQGIWLYAQVDTNLEVTYCVRCPDHWDPLWRTRMEKHTAMFNLKSIYRIEALKEIANSVYSWNLALRDSEEELRKTIVRARQGSECDDLNSWRSALYRYFEENLNQLIAYLRKKYKDPV